MITHMQHMHGAAHRAYNYNVSHPARSSKRGFALKYIMGEFALVPPNFMTGTWQIYGVNPR